MRANTLERSDDKRSRLKLNKDGHDAAMNEALPIANSRRFFDRIDGKVVVCEVYELTGVNVASGVYSMVDEKSGDAIQGMLLNTDLMGQVKWFQPIVRDGVHVSLSALLPTEGDLVWNAEFLDSPLIQSITPDPDIKIE